MVKFIIGPKGSGKTKWLIDRANEEMKKGNGNIVFIDVDDNHIFSLDYSVRLINAMEFNINNIESFYGFLCGIMAMDYDVEKIYIDGIYKVFKLKSEEMEKLKDKLEAIGEKSNIEFYIGSDLNISEMSLKLKESCIELEVD